MRMWYLILNVLSLTFGGTARVELNGPELISVPSPMTHFSNSGGLTLTCTGQGPPPLTVSWSSAAGEELPQIPGIREQLHNGSLYFGSFKPEDYIPAVHNGQYRCSVTNPVGTFLSPVFSVRAIVDHPFEVVITTSAIEDTDLMEGSPALLSCDVTPSFYNQFVRVIAWKTIDQFGHESEISPDDTRYQISSDGTLIIFTAKYQQLFVCTGESVLNKKIQASTPFLFKTKASAVGGVAPKRVFIKNNGGGEPTIITVEIGKATDLICLAVGSPSPNFRWEKYHKGKLVPVSSLLGSSVIAQGPLLRLNQVNAFHNGTYRCEVTNTFGTITMNFILVVPFNPLLIIEPQRKVLKNGQTVELLCKVNHHHQDPTAINNNGGASSSQQQNNMDFMWFKDGKPLVRSNRIKISFQKLLIFNTRLEDQGIYQCFTEVGSVHIQASSTLLFESSAPELVHTFISQSLQPGPSVSLKCSAIGNPIPTISWSIDGIMVSAGGVLSSSSSADFLETRFWSQYTRFSVGSHSQHQQSSETVSHLNISEIHVEDSGMYKCSANNLVGSVAHSARLNIYGAIFVKEMIALTLVAGQTALIPCYYGGYPVDKIIWQKDSRDIETSSEQSGSGKTTSGRSRFTILANGTLQIERIATDTDKGRYSCLVSNRKGEIASGSVDVNVMRPPVISAFKFDDNLKEGQRTSVSCNVISGDLPIDIFWLKDFKPIPTFLNVTENRVKFLSVLIFEELHNEHSGEYTCSASNAAAVVNQSGILRVKVPPKWNREPQDAKVILKSDHLLPCSATGVPQPSVSWSRDSSGIRSAIKTDHKFQVMEDGSLKILEVEETDAAIYICEAVNGVGNGISRSIRLYVIIPAKVSAPMTSVVVAEGLPTLLKCQIRGDRPIQVIWKKNSIVIEPQHQQPQHNHHSPRLVLQTVLEGNSSILSAELKIEPSERSDSGLYVCMASNQYGRDEDRISLEVKARPSPPENFMVEEIGSRFIRLRWSLGAQTSSSLSSPSALSSAMSAPVTYFILQWKKSLTTLWESGQVFNISVQSPLTQAAIESLSPVTNYDVRIFASNDIGHSFPTDPLAVLTLPEAPSGAPTNVSAIPIGPKIIVVRWEPPEPSLQHGAIVGYKIVAILQSVSSPVNNKTTVVDQKWDQQSEIKELRPNSQYRISVSAYNSAGMGPESPYVFIQTPEGAPDSPPVNLHCEPLSPKSLQVQWEPPPFHLSNGQILGYKVIYLPVEAEKLGEKPEVKKTSNRETTLHGLKSFTSYSVKTLAYTLGGESEISEPVVCTTEEDVPEEPQDIKVMTITATSALVSWLPPQSPNGIITKYTVFWKSDESEVVKEKEFLPVGLSPDEDQLSLEVRRLKDTPTYTFWITAATNSGSGKASRTETIQVSSTVPAKIASFPVRKNVRYGQPVKLPCKAIGIPSPKVTWLRNYLPLPSHSLLRNGSLFISRLRAEDEGTYMCKAENEHGNDEIEHTIVISRPPDIVPIFIGYVTDTSMQIHWDPPEKADPPLTAYVLEYHHQLQSQGSSSSTSSTQDWKSIRLGPRLTSYSLENLLCGSNYEFRITGENIVGRGETSPVLKARTNGHSPEFPKLTEILDGNGTMVRIDLTRWSDGGCPINNFNIEYKKQESTNWLRIYRKDNATRVFIFQTETSSRYHIKIRVENDAGAVTKTFKVESHPDFFTNYAKVLERVEVEGGLNGSYVSLYTDPHVLVPIVSAVICTFAIAVCVLMLIKRKNQAKPDWKFKQSSSQQTWLSSSDGASNHKCSGGNGSGIIGGENGSKCGEQGCGGNMSIYATLNSTKPIPMTIRDSTVRFQTFGQHENYEAPTVIPGYLKRNRRKSSASSPMEEVCMQQVSCQMEFPKQIEPPREFRSSSIPQQHHQQQLLHHLHHSHPNSDSDDNDPSATGVLRADDDGLYHDYSCPYQYTTAAPPGGGDSRRDIDNQPSSTVRPNTLKKKHGKTRHRGSSDYFE